MTFTVRGITNGNPVQVTWRDSRLEGNLGLVKLLEAYVEAGEPIDVTPTATSWRQISSIRQGFTMIVGEIPVVTPPEGDLRLGLTCRGARRSARGPRTPSALERDHARRWWRRIW